MLLLMLIGVPLGPKETMEAKLTALLRRCITESSELSVDPLDMEGWVEAGELALLPVSPSACVTQVGLRGGSKCGPALAKGTMVAGKECCRICGNVGATTCDMIASQTLQRGGQEDEGVSPPARQV